MAMNARCSLPERLSRHDTMVGLLQMRPDRLLAGRVAECAYDFLVLDAEHGTLSDDDFAESLRALAPTDVFGMVRLADHDPRAIARYLELGADGIVAPHVSTAEQARTLVSAMSSHRKASLLVLIESVLGADNAEEILAVEGIAAAFVGPNDLTADIGFPKDYAQPGYAQALARIERAAAVTGKGLGSAPHGQYSLRTLFSRGHRLFILGADQSLTHDALGAQLVAARSCFEVFGERS